MSPNLETLYIYVCVYDIYLPFACFRELSRAELQSLF